MDEGEDWGGLGLDDPPGGSGEPTLSVDKDDDKLGEPNGEPAWSDDDLPQDTSGCSKGTRVGGRVDRHRTYKSSAQCLSAMLSLKNELQNMPQKHFTSQEEETVPTSPESAQKFC